MDLLAQLSYDPEYGARPADRVMQREILSPVAEILLDGDAIPGSTICIDVTSVEDQPQEEQAQAELIFSLTYPQESKGSLEDEPHNTESEVAIL